MSVTLGPGLALTLIVIVALLSVALLSPVAFAAFLRSRDLEGPPEDDGGGATGAEGIDTEGDGDEEGTDANGSHEPGTIAADRDEG